MNRTNSCSTLFSSDVEFSKSTDSWSEFHTLPFLIEPKAAVILPNEDQTFTVFFTPVDVYDYVIQLKSTISNRAPEVPEIEIVVKAKSILPLYCFELEPSNYLIERRKGKKLCNDLLDQNTKIVEFESIGLGVVCTKKFVLRNPTKESFLFNWTLANKSSSYVPFFHCHTTTGLLQKGKSLEMVFSFIPPNYGTFEEFYFFSILSSQVRVTFLLVGFAREPRVFFDLAYLELPNTVINSKVTSVVLIRNDELTPYRFKFNKLSNLPEGLCIDPFQGLVNSEDKITIR